MSEEKIHRFTFCVEFIIQQERIDKPTDCFKTKQHKTASKEYFFSLYVTFQEVGVSLCLNLWGKSGGISCHKVDLFLVN